MQKLIFESNYKTLSTLFKNNKVDQFVSTFVDLDKKNLLCEKSYNLFAVYLTKIKNYSSARQYLTKSLIINEGYLPAKINLAGTLIYLKLIDQAKKLLEDLIESNPDNAACLKLLSQVYINLNEYKKAQDLLEKIIHLQPGNYSSYFEIGIFFYKLNQFAQSEIYLKQSVQLNSKDYNSKYYLALIYKIKKRIAESKVILNDLIRQYPKITLAYYTLSDILRGQGEFIESNLLLEKVLQKIDKDNLFSLYNLILSPHYKKKDHLVLHCENNYLNFSEDFQERIGYALFKYYDAAKNYLKASSYLKKSLQITNQKNKYSPEADNEQFFFLKNFFNQKFKNKCNSKQKLIKNIFIVGMQRSGSTLLEQILTSNSKLTSFGELPTFADLIFKYFPNQDLINFEKDLANSNESYFLQVGKEYNNSLSEICPFNISVDKMLSNFRMIGLIAACLPDSLIIHIYRNKNDNLLSIISNFFEQSSAPWSYNELHLKNYYNNYVSLMEHWKKNYPEKIIDICYEDLISNPKNEILKILKVLNVEWSDNFLNFQFNKNIIETASVYQARQKIYDSSIGRANNYKNYFIDLFTN